MWRPYHRALAALIERKRARFGLAVVLAAHSMPSVERSGRRAVAERREVRGGGASGAGNLSGPTWSPARCGRRSAAGRLIDAVEEHARGARLEVRHDEPYAGGFTTQHYGRPVGGVHVVQVELARRLYLDEVTLRRGPGFQGARGWCRELVGRFGALGTAAAAAAAAAPGGDGFTVAEGAAGGAGLAGAGAAGAAAASGPATLPASP